MISYVKVEVEIRGLARNEPDQHQSIAHILNRIECALRKEFHTQFDSDVDATLQESAGVKDEPNK